MDPDRSSTTTLEEALLSVWPSILATRAYKHAGCIENEIDENGVYQDPSKGKTPRSQRGGHARMTVGFDKTKRWFFGPELVWGEK